MKHMTLKTSAAAFCCAALLLSACAPAKTPAPAAIEDTPTPTVEVTAAPEYLEIPAAALSEKAEDTVSDRINAMLPVLDSLTRTMGIADDSRYAPDDADFVWGALYLIGENFPAADARITVDGDAITVPKAVMESFAATAFAGLSALPELPASMAEAMVYDASLDAYRLAPSDSGAAEIKLERWYSLRDGSAVAVTGLYNVDEYMGSLRFMLEKSDGAFPYAVTAAYPDSGASPTFMPLPIPAESSFDLDGDGANDEIAFSAGSEDSLEMTLKLASGETFTETYEYFYNPTAHVGDALKSDGTYELYVCGDTGSDDYETCIYRVKDGALEKTQIYGTVLGLDGNGTALADTAVDVLGTYGGLVNFKLAGDEFRFDVSSEYTVAQYDFDTRPLVTKKDGLTAADVATEEALTLPAGTKLLLLGTDCESYARLEREDGSEVLLALSRNSEYWGYRVGGEDESEWFEELLYAG